MTLSSIENRVSYSGNDSTTAFSFPYFFILNADLKVVLRDALGVETPQTITTQYTVTGAGLQAGGTVTMLTAPATGETLVIVRDPAQTQLMDLVENDDQPAETVEQAHDKAMMVVQRVQDLINRCLILKETDDEAVMEIPLKADRASLYLGFDAAGLPVPLAAPIGTTSITAYIATLLDDANAAAARATLGLAQIYKTPGTWNISVEAYETTVANDSIKITSADGTPLSVTNIGYVTLPSIVAGKLTTFTVTADVIMDLTLLDQGYAGGGDVTDITKILNALNNNNTLVWGVGTLSQVHLGIIDNADDSDTAVGASAPKDVFVNSALTADAQCLMVALFKIDFNDTGDINTVQTGDGEIVMGYQDVPISIHYLSSVAQALASGALVKIDYQTKIEATHNAVTIGASWAFTAPIAGNYIVSASNGIAPIAWSTLGQLFQVFPRIDDVTRTIDNAVAQVAATYPAQAAISSVFKVAKGAVINAWGFQNSGSAGVLNGNGASNFISITRIGN